MCEKGEMESPKVVFFFQRGKKGELELVCCLLLLVIKLLLFIPHVVESGDLHTSPPGAEFFLCEVGGPGV